MVIDFSRRTDPACPEGLLRLTNKLAVHGAPRVLHIWTKAPATVARMYGDLFRQLKNAGTIVCAQVTLNFYEPPVEQIPAEALDIKPLVDLLGSEAVRLRLDPVIAGYTDKFNIVAATTVATVFSIERLTVNFLVPSYKNVSALLSRHGIDPRESTFDEKKSLLAYAASLLPSVTEVAVCAENGNLIREVPGLKPAACSDPEWFRRLGADLSGLKSRKSRSGCGCFYTDDWGEYPSRGGYVCPHKCLYCYAGHNRY